MFSLFSLLQLSLCTIQDATRKNVTRVSNANWMVYLKNTEDLPFYKKVKYDDGDVIEEKRVGRTSTNSAGRPFTLYVTLKTVDCDNVAIKEYVAVKGDNEYKYLSRDMAPSYCFDHYKENSGNGGSSSTSGYIPWSTASTIAGVFFGVGVVVVIVAVVYKFVVLKGGSAAAGSGTTVGDAEPEPEQAKTEE